MAGGRALSFRKRKGSSPLHPPLRKETAFSRYFSGMGASYVEIAWLGRRMGGGCLSAACAFRVGASNCRKKTRLCGNGFSRKAKPRTAPYCLKPACAFRVGATICRKERACAARDFRARPGGKAKAYWRYVEPHTPPHRMNAPCAFRVGVWGRRLSQKGGLPRSPAFLHVSP